MKSNSAILKNHDLPFFEAAPQSKAPDPLVNGFNKIEY
jgi:hypothetical protein